jgi:hypothetical protein
MDKSASMPTGLKHLVPPSWKQAARETLSNWTFRRAMRRITNLPVGTVPTREMLRDLLVGWGNQGFSAEPDYLEAVAQAAVTTSTPILECGSGLTTILLGVLAGRRGVATWSLEHIPEWRSRILGVLDQFKIPGAHVCLAPLRDYEGFAWYDAPLDEMPERFQLAICDGPPGATAGGRYGLLPVLGHRLPVGSVILLDDASRPGEAKVLKRWTTEARMSVSMREASNGSFAVVTRN